MKIKFLLTACLCLNLFAASIGAATFTRTGIQTFWKTFKAAIAKNDQTAISAMTKFPLSMPYGAQSVKTKADFLKRYAEIFRGEADAAKCFPKTVLEKESATHYVAYCGFKKMPSDTENKPIAYHFELTKTRWQFTGLDNINE